jgi:N-acetylmuramoyl-L-alanine amidase
MVASGPNCLVAKIFSGGSMFRWEDFVRTLDESRIEFEHLKVIQLSQAILESGRGQSDLFQQHANPYGMKYRREMSQIAIPITYRASDGEDVYCKFDDLAWIFHKLQN